MTDEDQHTEQKKALTTEMAAISPDFGGLVGAAAASGPLKLEMSAFVRWISNVSESARTFEASVDIDVEWKASEADMALSDKEVLLPDWKPTVAPQLVCQNGYVLAEDIFVPLANHGSFELRRDKGVCFFRRRYTGHFFAPLDLRSFPFDVQSLPLIIEIGFMSTEKAVFVPPSSYDYTLWFCRDFSVLSHFFVCGLSSDYDNRNSFSRLTINLQVERNWLAYVYRLIMPVSLISGANLFLFSLPAYDGVADRLGFGVTLLLTMVAFEFTLMQDLPKDPHLSILDKYVKGSFVSLLQQLLFVSIAGWHHDRDFLDVNTAAGIARQETAENLDGIFFYISLAGWAFLQLYIVVAGMVAFARSGRRIKGCCSVMCGCVEHDAGRAGVMVLQSKHSQPVFSGEDGKRFRQHCAVRS